LFPAVAYSGRGILARSSGMENGIDEIVFPPDAELPLVIQGGMGIGVSNWQLARAVAREGQLGVVSGTCIDSLFIRRLQDGDPDGHLRSVMQSFPIPGVSAEALRRYYIPGGRDDGAAYKLLPMWQEKMPRARIELTMLASYCEVMLAREGHDGPIGLNLLTKVQLPNLATLYGAMLAGVSYVIMGAGIPREIPGVLDAFARGDAARMRFDIEGLPRDEVRELVLDPNDHFENPPVLYRPKFIPVVSAHSLAVMLARKANGRIDGFIVEAPIAGGHNAPPRGTTVLNELGEPVYSARDHADLTEMRAIGLPFWIAGGAASPDGIRDAIQNGAAGVQVGTLFAFCEESGVEPELKKRALTEIGAGRGVVHTDPSASPTGFPFKVLQIEETNAVEEHYQRRIRNCDLGYLRTAYLREDGRTGYRCPAEPVDTYIAKGGNAEDTDGRKCLCNALLANVGHAQSRSDGDERALLTSGNDLTGVAHLLTTRESYSAAEAIRFLLSPSQ
jgi:NAD(P)H-dependent flavin oxidoreductase YrpB (nitropropane dioxygenase family)